MPSLHHSLAEWLAYQEQLHPRSIALGLERVRAVAQRLGLLPAPMLTLTIGGTNGKGSSATLAALIYREAGYRVGCYTSPHLLRYNERIAIDGVPVSDADCVRAFAAIEAARAEIALTYFEFGTLAALWLFREARVDVQVLEVGLGGRLDAVNIVDADAALVTNIGLDHTDWLGNTRDQIGYEKAGIYRSGRPAVCADPQAPVGLLHQARSLGAQLLLKGEHYDTQISANGRWYWRGPGAPRHDLPPPGLQGEAQYQNAAGVLALIGSVAERCPVPGAAIHRALPQLRLPGRFERRGAVILDVAHNAEAAAVLADNLRAAGLEKRIHLVLGMLSDKPVATVLEHLLPLANSLHVGGLPGPRGLSAGALLERGGAALPATMRATMHTDIPTAFASARAQAGEGEVVVVTGSFLTVAALADVLDS